MKADRLLSALLLLQARGLQTGRELARRLEVSQRTVHRDMEALGAAGVPVFAVRGPQGGWQLDEGWRTRVPGLDESELRALLMAQPRVMGDSRLARSAERALDKLVAALPAPLRDQASSIRKRLHVDTTGWSGTPEDLSLLPDVQEAVASDRKLAMVYRPAAREAGERIVDPLGLVAKGGTWYLVAHTPAGYRTYRVSRIEQARLLDASFDRPAGFDLAAYWEASTDELRNKRWQYEATLRLEPTAAASCRRWRKTSLPSPSTEPALEGWETLRVHFDDEEQAAFVVLGFGPKVDVIEPAGLRARVVADHAAAVERTTTRAARHRQTPQPARRRRN
jgi:predicted DNA-binding transcriptional regulator YafY